MARNDMIDVEDLEFVRETQSGIIVKDSDRNEVCLPQSQIEWPDDAERGDIITVTMPEWLAMDRGLI